MIFSICSTVNKSSGTVDNAWGYFLWLEPHSSSHEYPILLDALL